MARELRIIHETRKRAWNGETWVETVESETIDEQFKKLSETGIDVLQVSPPGYSVAWADAERKTQIIQFGVSVLYEHYPSPKVGSAEDELARLALVGGRSAADTAKPSVDGDAKLSKPESDPFYAWAYGPGRGSQQPK